MQLPTKRKTLDSATAVAPPAYLSPQGHQGPTGKELSTLPRALAQLSSVPTARRVYSNCHPSVCLLIHLDATSMAFIAPHFISVARLDQSTLSLRPGPTAVCLTRSPQAQSSDHSYSTLFCRSIGFWLPLYPASSKSLNSTVALITSVHPNRCIYSVMCDLRTDINS